MTRKLKQDLLARNAMMPDLPLSSETLSLVDSFLEDSPVDEATVWLESDDGEHLEAVYNPVNDTLPGLRQPLSQGLISQVFATGLPLLERDVSKRRGHDPRIDAITGSPTRALLAAPISAGDQIVGVLSAVCLAGSDHPRQLRDEDLGHLSQLADTLGKAYARSEDDANAD